MRCGPSSPVTPQDHAVSVTHGGYPSSSHPDAPDPVTLLAVAEQRIDLLDETLIHLLARPDITDLLSDKAGGGCQIRILIAHPDSTWMTAQDVLPTDWAPATFPRRPTARPSVLERPTDPQTPGVRTRPRLPHPTPRAPGGHRPRIPRPTLQHDHPRRQPNAHHPPPLPTAPSRRTVASPPPPNRRRPVRPLRQRSNPFA